MESADELALDEEGTAGSGRAWMRLVPDYSPKTLRRDLLVRELRGAVVAVTPCSAPPAVAGTMSLTGQEKFETAPTDKRFPTTNQAKHCYM